MFWFKPSPIHLDCFTARPDVYGSAPIQPVSHFVPDWWKALPKTYMEDWIERPTMRTCAGFVDLFSRGVVLPMWSDLHVRVNPESKTYNWQFSDNKSQAVLHNPVQAGTLLEDLNVYHLKLTSPWHFRTKKDIRWHFSQPMWNQNMGNEYAIPPGMVNYKYHGLTHVNLLLRNPPAQTVVKLSHGMALAHIIPLTERPLKIHNHLVSEAEFYQLSEIRMLSTFTGWYYKRKKMVESGKLKCPFTQENE